MNVAEKYRGRNYLSGTYIIRMRVTPKEPQMYFWRGSINERQLDNHSLLIHNSSILSHNIIQNLSMRTLRKKLILKFRNLYIPESEHSNRYEYLMIQKNTTNFDHHCCETYKIPAIQSPADIRKKLFPEYDHVSMLIVIRNRA